MFGGYELLMRRFVKGHPWIVPLCGHVVIVFTLALTLGWPIFGGDSSRILGESGNLASGAPMGPTGLAFLVPHWLLSIASAYSLQTQLYVALQLVISGVATVAFFQLALMVVGNTGWAILATCFWSMNPLVQKWNFYIVSDGLYQSLLIIYAYFLILTLTKGGKLLTGITFAILLAAVFCRPHGRLLPIATACVLFVAPSSLQYRRLLTIGLIVLEISLILLNQRYSVHMNMVQHFEAGRVIWGFDGLTLSMPPSHPTSSTGMASVIEYTTSYPLQSARLAVTRILVEIGHIRPFYSFGHNLLSAIVYWPLVLLAMLGISKSSKSITKTVCLAFSFFHLGIVGITHADWDGRWFIQVLPFIVVWGFFGIAWLFKSIPLNNKSAKLLARDR